MTILAFAACLAGCVEGIVPPPEISLNPVTFGALDGWYSGAQAGAGAALRLTCESISKKPPGRAIGAVAGLTAGMWRPLCDALEEEKPADDAAMREFLERWFRPYAVETPEGDVGLFTGYFEIEIEGAIRPGGRFQTPIHGRPRDLVSVELGRFDRSLAGRSVVGRVEGGRLVPYYGRRNIGAGALDGVAAPFLWAADPVDLFFLQIQGSGRVRLADGEVVRIGFAAHNGRPYTSIGRVLKARGALPPDGITMQSIRSWLSAHPDEARDVMNENARYVFFRPLDSDAPVGAAGVPLSPGRSLAIDRRMIPFGAPVWLETQDPLNDQQPFRRLMVAQDTGGAIKGAVRGDIFFGSGPDAERAAGAMSRPGRYFLLLPRAFRPPS